MFRVGDRVKFKDDVSAYDLRKYTISYTKLESKGTILEESNCWGIKAYKVSFDNDSLYINYWNVPAYLLESVAPIVAFLKEFQNV